MERNPWHIGICVGAVMLFVLCIVALGWTAGLIAFCICTPIIGLTWICSNILEQEDFRGLDKEETKDTDEA